MRPDTQLPPRGLPALASGGCHLEPYESFWHETQRTADPPYLAAVFIGCVMVAVLMFSAGFLVGRDVYMAPCVEVVK